MGERKRTVFIAVATGALTLGGIGLALGNTVWEAVYGAATVKEAVYQQDDVPPSAPTSLTAKDKKLGGMIELKWDYSKSDDAVGYNIYRLDELGEKSKANTEPIAVNVFLDRGLENGKEYTYFVTAVDASGNESRHSNQITAMPTLDITPPPVPTSITLRDLQIGKKIYLQWSAVQADDLVGYYLYRRDKGEWQKVNSEPVPEVSTIDTSITNGTVYHYRVTSVDDVGNESAPSPEVRGWGTNQYAKIVWQYGKTGTEGTGRDRLYAPYGVSYSLAGRIYVADTHNGRVQEIDEQGQILWSYAKGLIEPTRIKAIDNERILIVDSGAARVLIINKTDNSVIWSYGQGKRKHGRKQGQLNNPGDADVLANGHVLIADTGNGRVLEVSPEGQVVWTTEQKSFRFALGLPTSVEILSNGNMLVTDAGLEQVLELDRQGDVVWSFGGKGRPVQEQLGYPSESVRLANDNTLIMDSMNYRLLEVTLAGEVIWTFGEKTEQKSLFEPASVAWLPDNQLLIADQHNHRLVRVDH